MTGGAAVRTISTRFCPGSRGTSVWATAGAAHTATATEAANTLAIARSLGARFAGVRSPRPNTCSRLERCTITETAAERALRRLEFCEARAVPRAPAYVTLNCDAR
jgi:hypothetical protein